MPEENRSPLAVAAEWSSQIISAAAAFGFPVVLGYWFDQRFGTKPLAVLAGVALGMLAGGWQMWGIVRRLSERSQRQR